MGWWGHDILSGDQPLDLVSFYTEQLGIEPGALDPYPDGDAGLPETRQHLFRFARSGHTQIARVVHHVTGTDSDGPNPDDAQAVNDVRIAWQVLAIILMGAGAPIDPATHTTMRHAGKNDLWATTDPGRQAAIDRYLTTLDRYDQVTPTHLRSATIADASRRAAHVGHTGLLNLHPPAP